jgi:DNA polymerase-3 subunit gamma/tau
MSSDTVFYRKYRPNQLRRVVGQKAATSLLTKSCEREMFHHAYLFYGPNGTGKTSTARILSSILTCSNRKQGDTAVCGECRACNTVALGGGSDIKELDGAKDGTKDEIRAIIQNSQYPPQELSKRIFIIDEFHKMSSDAMTALLKPIEEPLGDVVFILCTTDFRKVPPEIASRCQRIQFRTISDEVVSNYMLSLCKHVGINCDEGSAINIGRVSRGSMRTALNLLQAAHTTYGNEIKETDIRNLLGLAGRDIIYQLVECISKEDVDGALGALDEILDASFDIITVSKELSEILRNAMINKARGKVPPGLTAEEVAKIDSISKSFAAGRLENMCLDFSETSPHLEININPRWVLESLVVRLTQNDYRNS